MPSDPYFRVVIPARFASSRFPGKPLARLAGLPVIEHVHRCALESGAAEVLVATDDLRIAEAVEEFGGQAVMTRADHESGTDRVAEVAMERAWKGDALVVNLQGDAPLLPPDAVRQAVRALSGTPSADMSTICCPMASMGQFNDTNVVKVVADGSGRALYFSRAAIPSPGHDTGGVEAMAAARRHIGLYVYRLGALQKLTDTPACPLEKLECLEQLRALWLGMKIRVVEIADFHAPDVDTPEDLELVRSIIAERNGVRL